MTNVYKEQATAILVNQFSSYAKKLTDFSDRVYNILMEKGPLYDDSMFRFRMSDECYDTLHEILKEQGYTSFTQYQLNSLAEELIYSSDGSRGIYSNFVKKVVDLFKEYKIEGEPSYLDYSFNGMVWWLSWEDDEGVCDLNYDDETGLLLNAKKEYKTLRKDGVEKYISCLLSHTPEEYYEQIVNGKLDYDGVINKNPELKEDFITIQEIEENKNSEGKPLIDNRIPEVLEEVLKMMKTQLDFAYCQKLLSDYAKKNLNIVESVLEKTKEK